MLEAMCRYGASESEPIDSGVPRVGKCGVKGVTLGTVQRHHHSPTMYTSVAKPLSPPHETPFPTC